MDVMEMIKEIETGNDYWQEGLDYHMDCKVTVNNVRTRCDQVSIVQCDMSKYGKGIELLLELRRGDFISWIYLDEVESFDVKMMDNVLREEKMKH